MSDAPATTTSPEPTTTIRKRLPFRAGSSTPRLKPEAVERQSAITLMAWKQLGPDAAIPFLNTFNASLQGRPLDLAIRSAAGYEAVSDEIQGSAPRSTLERGEAV